MQTNQYRAAIASPYNILRATIGFTLIYMYKYKKMK